ncbi:hypothetical protein B9Z55_017508 [Caenorhabditis nigoni]|uniref:Tc1-like transposase DDE domain-containing protein n=1 Tax=Caenorhabditis nigoni TaxID=1611254 RepID=A0A2G5TA12_9PELO|nr:hypothetical protein B9Z55_017508 [Caenorhabditis nigoni]
MEHKSLCQEDARHTPYKLAPARRKNDPARRKIRRTPDVEAVMPTAEEKKSLLEKAYAEEKKHLQARKVEEEKEIESPGHIAGKGEHLTNTVYKNIVKLKEALGESAKECMINNVLDFASAILGVDRSTVVAHAHKIPASPPSRVPQTRKYRRERAAGMMSVEDKREIMDHLQSCWKNDQFVSLKGLLKWARSSINYQYGLSTLGCALAGMGLCYRQKSHNPIIEERRDLIFLREKYLKEMKYLRTQNAYFVFFDETWVFAGMVLSKGWQIQWGTMYERARLANIEEPLPGPKKGKNKGKRGIVMAVISEDGILEGSEKVIISGGKVDDQKEDYHQEMTASLCEDYLINNVFPSLLKAAADAGRPPVLVLDNASYHCRTIENAPTSASKIAEIKEFLDSEGVHYDRYERKTELYKKVQEHMKSVGGRTVFKKYFVDEVARKRGIQVIRLPPYHCFLNPIEMFWSQLKQEVRTVGSTSSRLEEVRDLSLQFMANFSSEASLKLFNKVEKEENKLRELLEIRSQELKEIAEEPEQFEIFDSDGILNDDFHNWLVALENDGDELEDDDFISEPFSSIFEAADTAKQAAVFHTTEDLRQSCSNVACVCV